jgi:hypothetical protein
VDILKQLPQLGHLSLPLPVGQRTKVEHLLADTSLLYITQ